MAKQNNAVLAINGDYFIYHSEGIVYRNTHRLRELPREYRDTMIIDTEGGMHIIQGTTHQNGRITWKTAARSPTRSASALDW